MIERPALVKLLLAAGGVKRSPIIWESPNGALIPIMKGPFHAHKVEGILAQFGVESAREFTKAHAPDLAKYFAH